MIGTTSFISVTLMLNLLDALINVRGARQGRRQMETGNTGLRYIEAENAGFRQTDSLFPSHPSSCRRCTEV